ncbi:MAG: SGNH/GDSL hydrolase family protein [Armatimonadota bacterium]
MYNVILIGDSIRMGYQEVVRQELAGFAEIWAPEDNCDTSTTVLARLDEWVLSRKPDLGHLNCGLHDLKRQFDAPTQTTLPDYQHNLEEIFRRILALGKTKLIWATTTPVNGQWHHERKGFDRWEADVDAYNQAAGGVVRRFDLPVNDLFTLVMQTGRDGILTPDGVHYTEEGCRVLGKQVADIIRRELTK